MSTTSASTSRGRRPRSAKKKAASHPIRLIRITDRPTGVLLFERTYRWAEHTNTANLGSLVQSFFQFAREVDGGEVESVCFEEPSMQSTPTPRTGGSGEQARGVSFPADNMIMVNAKTEDVVVVLFHDLGSQDVFSHFVGSVAIEFSNTYGVKLSEMRDTMAGLSDSMLDSDSHLNEIKAIFDEFGETIDGLKSEYFKPLIAPDSSHKSLSTEASNSFNF